MDYRVDCVVIGAGVIGLAIARRLARAGMEPLVLEAAGAIGTGISSRNSEVIHAGIYYPAGSLKAQTCVSGRAALYAYCQSHGIGHRRCGKLIVATSESQVAELHKLASRALQNGVADLLWQTPQQVREKEQAVSCVAALWSPSTGIIDSHALMLSYQADAEAAGALFSFRAPVRGGRIDDDGIVVAVGGDSPLDIRAERVINAAGLHAHEVAASLQGLPAQFVPTVHYAKGNYFALAAAPPFRRLVYPLHEQAGLGIHATIDLAGQVRFGPDVEWVGHIDYEVDPARAEAFYRSVRDYYPALPDHSLHPAYCGIRPKLQGPGEVARDFVIQGPAEHGIDGLVNLFGIESPGLTASLAIADRVAELL
jgi:L-2-hydroxyglutarate oxidase LhgO